MRAGSLSEVGGWELGTLQSTALILATPPAPQPGLSSLCPTQRRKGLALICPSLNGYKKQVEGFPGGAVVKNPPANAGDTGSIPSPGRSHMPWSN